MKNKGSLALSVNTIIVLIIALTVLGLVIGFAVTKFGDLSSKITITEDTPEPTPQQPITLPGGGNSLTLSKQQETLMEIGVYNSGGSPIVLTSFVGSGGGAGLFTCSQIGTTTSSSYCTTVLGCGAAPTDFFQNPTGFCTGTGTTSGTVTCETIERPSGDPDMNTYCSGLGCSYTSGTTCSSGGSGGGTGFGFTCSPQVAIEVGIAPITIAAGETADLSVSLKAGSTATPGKKACTLNIGSVKRSVFLTIE